MKVGKDKNKSNNQPNNNLFKEMTYRIGHENLNETTNRKVIFLTYLVSILSQDQNQVIVSKRS